MNIIESINKFRAEHGRAFACIVSFVFGFLFGVMVTL